MTRRLRLASLLGAAALALAACSGSTATTAPATPAAATDAPTVAPASAPAPETPSGAPSEAPSEATASCQVVEGGAGTAAEIKGFAYPAALTVATGGSVTWTNADGAPHTVTFDDGTCASGSIGPGASVTVRYDVAGSFAFHCAIHPRMAGTLVVGG